MPIVENCSPVLTVVYNITQASVRDCGNQCSLLGKRNVWPPAATQGSAAVFKLSGICVGLLHCTLQIVCKLPEHYGVSNSHRKPHLGFLSERADQVMLSQQEIAFEKLLFRPLAEAVAVPGEILTVQRLEW